MTRFLTTTLVLTLWASTSSAILSTPHVAGDFQGWDAGLSAMTETSLGSGIFTASFTGMAASSRHEFKITDGTWTNSYPGPNSWLYSDLAGGITISYDTNTYADGWSTTTERLGLSYDNGLWTAAGDFQSEIGGSDWDNASAASVMTSIGGDKYQLDAYPGAGTWQWKAVKTGSWDSISWDQRSVGTANWSFTLNAGEFARLTVDATGGTVKQEVLPIPEPASLGLMVMAAVGMMSRRRHG